MGETVGENQLVRKALNSPCCLLTVPSKCPLEACSTIQSKCVIVVDVVDEDGEDLNSNPCSVMKLLGGSWPSHAFSDVST